MYFVYILHSAKLSRYYIGQTNNIDRRLKYHNSGLGNYTSKGVPWILLWCTEKSTRSEAIILEKKCYLFFKLDFRTTSSVLRIVVTGP